MTDSRSRDLSGGNSEKSRAPDTLLKVEGVSKKFAYSLRHTMRYGTSRILRELLGMRSQTEQLRPGEFWALEDVSFELKRGETLGVIGHNGAGKSTLLKLISGVFLPDKGRIAVRGTVGGLIELGAGFQPKLSGRDNIYVIGSVLGFSRRQIDALIDDIMEFADLAEFIDSPVQTYSSGMQVRLGFAIHVFQRPDILVADEVLAVGDFEFQQKCLAKINEIRGGMGFVFVSHSMPSIVRFCDRAVVLARGKKVFDGPPDEAVGQFTRAISSRCMHQDPEISTPPDSGHDPRQEDPGNCLGDGHTHVVMPSLRRIDKLLFGPWNTGQEKFSELRCTWSLEKVGGTFAVRVFSELQVEISFRVDPPQDRLVIGIPIYSCDGQQLTAFNTDALGCEVPRSDSGHITARLCVRRLSLVPGEYVPLLVIQDGLEYFYRNALQPFSVQALSAENGGHASYYGLFAGDFSWIFNETGCDR
jgi:ABC-type polysaccharide/polyol phosphate transport system ATPase subunit